MVNHLKTRRVRDTNLSEEVKWTKLYETLFPQDTSTPSPFHERSMAECKASLMRELDEHLCQDFSRLWQPRFTEMFTSNCNENNGVPDIEKISRWTQDFVRASYNSFAAASSTSGEQNSTTSPGLPSQASSLHFTGTTSVDSPLGYSSQTSFRHNQQISGTPSNPNIDPQFLSSFWGNSPSMGVDTTQFNVGGFYSAHPPGGME
jgi:hypothetical protein